MNDCAIGIFDSGIGGLALVDELNKYLPDEDIIFHYDPLELTDTENDKNLIKEYINKNIQYFLNKNVKMILSCSSEANTVSGLKTPDTQVKYSGVFLPAAQAACGATKNNKIGILGSAQVVKKGGYVRVIKNIKPNAAVTGCICPMLSQIIETGLTAGDPAVRLALEQSLQTLIADKTDTVILADGHYTAVRTLAAEILGPSVAVISPFEETAKQAYNYLLSSDLLTFRETTGLNRIDLETDHENFSGIASMFIERENTVFSDCRQK
ncbi:MAG: hypothetical protein Q4F95_06990 [Oscillospiraceae bacterium]|nr:hypothetical protein [Oscillospiraceae bacterium]